MRTSRFDSGELCLGSRVTGIEKEHAAQFWRKVEGLVREFTALPRSGETVYGFAVGLYPTDQPVLPEPAAADPEAADPGAAGPTTPEATRGG